MNNKTYHLTYKTTFQDPPVTEEAFKDDEEVGLCDSLLLGSIVIDAEGNSSYMFFGWDGPEHRPFTPKDKFRAWCALAYDLSQSLPDGHSKDFCNMVHQTIKQTIGSHE